MSQSQSAPVCPECDGPLRVEPTETVCSRCGLVVDEDPLDRGPEWRGIDDARERTGAPLTRSRHDRGLSTEIGRGGPRVTGRKRRRLARLRRQHNRALIGSKADRNRVYAFTEIRRLADRLSLPEATRDSACMLFGRAQDEDLLRGRSLEGFAAAAIYAVCRIGGLSRTLGEVAAAAKASPDELRAAYDAMNRELGLPTAPIDPAEYLPRFASGLDLPPAIETRADEFAAACLYAAAAERGYPLTQKRAASVADVTSVTLRSTYTKLLDEGLTRRDPDPPGGELAA